MDEGFTSLFLGVLLGIMIGCLSTAAYCKINQEIKYIIIDKNQVMEKACQN